MPEKTPQYRPPKLGGMTATEAERHRFYHSNRWKNFRRVFLVNHPLCEVCAREGRDVPADSVHHIVERLDDPTLSFDPTNCESICRPCHTREHNARRSRGA